MAAVIDGTERTFLDRYGDYFWFALLLLSGIGSAGAWLRHYLNRDEREENTSHRNKILAMVSRVRTAESNQELLAMQREVDAIIGETLECYDDGAIPGLLFEWPGTCRFAATVDLESYSVTC